jgi:hypothetical protein
LIRSSSSSAQRIEAARDSASRKFIASYKCWKICGDRNCLRARACTGDAQACFLFFWKFLPEQDRTWLLTAIRSERGGMSREEAMRAADAAIAGSVNGTREEPAQSSAYTRV